MAIYKKIKLPLDLVKNIPKISAGCHFVKRRRRHAFTGTYILSAASNPTVLVEYYRPKQAPNLPFGQNFPVSILT